MEITEELIEAFLQTDHEMPYVLNTKTKEVFLDAPEAITGEPEIDWEDDKAVESFVVIPQITSTEAYNLMVKFAQEQDATIATELLDLLNERKPFRSFKDKISEQGIGDSWYEFENDYARNRMLEWLEQV